MRSLEKSHEKMQKICDQIRKDTIEPAKQEAEEMLSTARKRAEELIRAGEHQAAKLVEQAKKQIAQEQAVFRSSLEQAAKQTVETLRQEVEEKFFSEEIATLITSPLRDPKVLADLTNALEHAIEKEGLSADFSVVIPKLVSADDITPLLLESVAKRLKEHPLQIGAFQGGIQVKLRDKKMVLDVSDSVLIAILADYVRADFRHCIFGR